MADATRPDEHDDDDVADDDDDDDDDGEHGVGVLLIAARVCAYGEGGAERVAWAAALVDAIVRPASGVAIGATRRASRRVAPALLDRPRARTPPPPPPPSAVACANRRAHACVGSVDASTTAFDVGAVAAAVGSTWRRPSPPSSPPPRFADATAGADASSLDEDADIDDVR